MERLAIGEDNEENIFVGSVNLLAVELWSSGDVPLKFDSGAGGRGRGGRGYTQHLRDDVWYTKKSVSRYFRFEEERFIVGNSSSAKYVYSVLVKEGLKMPKSC